MKPVPLVQETYCAVERIDQSKDLDGIVNALAATVSPLGVTAFAFAGIPVDRPAVLLDGWPQEWQTWYAAAGHYDNDPCAAHCRQTSRPFTWDEIPSGLRERPRAARVLDDARDFGFRDGFCIPLHTGQGLRGISLAGRSLDLPTEARRLVHVVSVYACSAAEALLRAIPRAPVVLTRRQREVLTWIAVGKSVEDVAQILSVSSHTVTEHLRAARARLGTSNSVHSVVEAIRRGEVSI
jgi:LuxR family quorum sensing-dependent transcriptional regulator